MVSGLQHQQCSVSCLLACHHLHNPFIRHCSFRSQLSEIPCSHVWPFQQWQDSDKASYLLRQHVYSNLHHRLSTRPFLSSVEKVRHCSRHTPEAVTVVLILQRRVPPALCLLVMQGIAVTVTALLKHCCSALNASQSRAG